MSVAEATTKEELSTDGYSKENKGEKEAKHFYKIILCWKGAGPDKNSMGFLQVQEIFGTNLFFGWSSGGTSQM